MHKRLTSLAVLALLAAPAGANAFAPGEETVFRITYLSLPTGEGRIVVGKPEGDIWPVIFQAKTEGVAGLIDIREHLVSYWDARTKLTRGSDLKAYEVGTSTRTARGSTATADKATVTVHRKGKKKEDDRGPRRRAGPHERVHVAAPPAARGRPQRHESRSRPGRTSSRSSPRSSGARRVETPAGTFPSSR